MLNNSAKIMFYWILIGSIFITMSSNSWLAAWMGLEINLISFIPLMSNVNNIYTTEASMKYFLIQAVASSILLFMVLFIIMNKTPMTLVKIELISVIMMIPLMMKCGIAPLHWWFPKVMEGLDWINCFILMTLQKIAPMIMISYIMMMNWWMILTIMLSVVIGAISGFNQISVRKMLAYSSINHMGWMLSALLINEMMWSVYLLVYSMLIFIIISIMKASKISTINQVNYSSMMDPTKKLMMMINLLSLGGLPPFIGFLPKWFIIQSMENNNMTMLMMLMVVMSVITLYYYMRLMYNSILMINLQVKWFMYSTSDMIGMYQPLLTLWSITNLILTPAIMLIMI